MTGLQTFRLGGDKTLRKRFALTMPLLGLAGSLLLSMPAGAGEEWKSFAQHKGDLVAINLAGIEKSDDLFFAEYRVSLASETDSRFGQGNVSELRKKLALSCGSQLIAIIDVLELDAAGALLGRAGLPREQWKFFEPSPGSTDWKFRQLVCRAFPEQARRSEKTTAPAGEPASSAPRRSGPDREAPNPPPVIEKALPQ